MQPSPEPHSEEQTKRTAALAASSADAAASSNGKAAKDPSKPSPSKDRRDSNMWEGSKGAPGASVLLWLPLVRFPLVSLCFIVSTQWSPCYTGITCLVSFVSTMQRLKIRRKKKRRRVFTENEQLLLRHLVDHSWNLQHHACMKKHLVYLVFLR